MKPFALILIVLNILSIHCHNLRNLKLAISPEKLKTLTDAATKTFKQIFQKDIDFQGTTVAKLDDVDKKLEIAIYEDQSIPTAAFFSF